MATEPVTRTEAVLGRADGSHGGEPRECRVRLAQPRRPIRAIYPMPSDALRRNHLDGFACPVGWRSSCARRGAVKFLAAVVKADRGQRTMIAAACNQRSWTMSAIKNVTHHTIFKHPEHCVNQIAMRVLKNGDLLAVFNEERFPYHHDSGQTLMARSKDGGKTWGAPTVVLPWTDTQGNWDCGICELADGTLLVNMTITGFFRRGIKPEGVSWSNHPKTREWGDWTWAYKTQGWLGTYVVKSKDGGATWSQPIPVNVRPLKHGGCRLGCWQLPNGSILMGLYGRIHGYEEEGEGESTRSALMRSDDGGDNWEYYSTLAYDPASIIDYEEPAVLRLSDGRLVCFMRTHVNPTSDAKNMVMVVSEDDGFSWTPPKWLNIWGYPPEAIALQDGRYLMVYGYRRPPYGTRGCISADGVTWDIKNEFIVREGGVPGKTATETPGSSRMGPVSGKVSGGGIDWSNPGVYQHIGYPTVQQMPDGTVVAAYHEWSDDEKPLQFCLATRFTVEK